MMTLLVILLCAFVALAQGAVSPHIIGGEEATHGDHPYICSLQYHYDNIWYHMCGSVIWNDRAVITAAHCVEWDFQYRVVCGSHKLDTNDTGQVTHAVRYKHIHKDYLEGPGTFPNDIAGLILHEPLVFTDYVRPAPFAKETDGDFAFHNCILSGWGVTDDGDISNSLQKVTMMVVPNYNCSDHWSSANGVILDSHVCVLDHQKSSCNGDSGGPMRCGDRIVGLTSWGIRGCGAHYPSVYTRVSSFFDWLECDFGPQPCLVH